MSNIEYITIAVKASDEQNMFEIRDKIHNILVGNKDYVDSNIVLSDSDCINGLNNPNDHVDDNCVFVYIFKECKDIPNILSKISHEISNSFI